MNKDRSLEEIKKELDKLKQEYEDRKGEEETKNMVRVIKSFGGKNINTNGYWFNFIKDGVYVFFVNQKHRICGEMYREPKSDKEREMQRKYFFLKHGNEKERKLAEQLRVKTKRREFVICGSGQGSIKEVFDLVEGI